MLRKVPQETIIKTTLLLLLTNLIQYNLFKYFYIENHLNLPRNRKFHVNDFIENQKQINHNELVSELDSLPPALSKSCNFSTHHKYTNAGHLPSCEKLFKEQILGKSDQDAKFSIDLSVESLSWEEINKKIIQDTMNNGNYQMNNKGNENDGQGCFFPKHCEVEQETLLIVPYRDRDSHLKVFTYNIHKFLQKQHRSYCILISEQKDKGSFNRAKLMNTAAISGLDFYYNVRKFYPDCYIFSDVDLLPENLKNLYGCLRSTAIHLADKIDKFNYTTQFIAGPTFSSGGAIAIHRLHYEGVNGHPNWYWGWGIEDHDMANRLRKPDINIFQSSKFKPFDPLKNSFQGLTDEFGTDSFQRQEKYGTYKMLKHNYGLTSGKQTPLLEVGPGPKETLVSLQIVRQDFDGFRSTIYQLDEEVSMPSFTKMRFEIRPAVAESILVTGSTSEDINTEEFKMYEYKKDQTSCEYVKITDCSLQEKDRPVKVPFVHNDDNLDQNENNKEFYEHFEKASKTCLKENNDGPQCNAISDKSSEGSLETRKKPFPIFNRYKSEHFTIIRSCPSEHGLTQVATDYSADNFENLKIKPNLNIFIKKNFENTFYLKFNLTTEILQEPVGVLAYTDKIVSENTVIHKELLGMWVPKISTLYEKKIAAGKKDKKGLNENLSLNPREYQHENSTVTAKVERLDETRVRFEIIRPVKVGLTPGIYVIRSKITDFWGQPYLDLRLIFKIRSFEGERYEDLCFEPENRQKWLDRFKNVKLKHEMNFFYQARSSLMRHGLISKLTDVELSESSLNHWRS